MNIRWIRSAKLLSIVKSPEWRDTFVVTHATKLLIARLATQVTPHQAPVLTLSERCHPLLISSNWASNASCFRVLTLNLVNVRLSVHYIFPLPPNDDLRSLLTETCNRQGHLSPLRFSHASLHYQPRRKGESRCGRIETAQRNRAEHRSESMMSTICRRK